MFFIYFCLAKEKSLSLSLMYQYLLFFHSIFRWLVLLSMGYAIYRAVRGLRGRKAFTRHDNAVRHWTATIAHVQLALGLILYTKSTLIKYFWSALDTTMGQPSVAFFGWFHILAMLASVVLVTLGSAFAKRKATEPEKFRTMLLWFSLALLLILLAIPWPFSPFAPRPYIRTL